MLTAKFFHICIHLSILYYSLSKANPLVGEKVVPANENEFPFFVVLSSFSDITKVDGYFCGGNTLVSKRHVITSKHCVVDEDYNVTLIVNPASSLNRTVYKVESWITFDDWAVHQNILTEGIDNDIAIITLSEDVRHVKPAVISKLKHKRVIGKKVVAAGWGYVDEANRLTSDSLMKAHMTVLNYTEYRKNIAVLFGRPTVFRFNSYYTSASLPAVLACGDSGGPLLLASNKELVGINDSGCDGVVDVSKPHATSRHVSLVYYKKFIDDIVKD